MAVMCNIIKLIKNKPRSYTEVRGVTRRKARIYIIARSYHVFFMNLVFIRVNKKDSLIF